MVYLGKKMETEKVPNVLLAFLNSYPKAKEVKGGLSAQSKKDFSAAIRKMKEVPDEDVQYFIEVAEKP